MGVLYRTLYAALTIIDETPRDGNTVTVAAVTEAFRREIQLARMTGEEQWIWKNGLVVRMKTQISTLTRKVENFNVKICSVGGQDVVSTGGHLKDMLDLNTELIGYLSSLTDNVNVRDLFDFLTICYCEYDHFFKDHRREITSERQQRTVLLPLAYDIVFSEIKGILDFITNNTVNYSL